MREIEFRVWVNESKVLQEVTKLESLQTVTKLEFDIDGHLNYLESWDDNTCQKYGFLTEADDIELSQYTGLKDKNGKKIFEGDIIKYTSENDEHFISVVKYFDDDYYPAFDIVFPGDWEPSANGFSQAYWCGESIEIIGNKWQNPELLEAE
ncbi:YopX family protein [Listeria fleischmannii]|uniref:YopX family protein n=1 Tax=Listeria fleischmannii TaxID=1069827 RepID=UPI000254F9C0|nr:YopX family protein [Listeria fleischmannii]EIA21396.1 hypothetical protein KKC_01362 [Listeria fleischmannii subsp. coloradonensis]STY35280.1 YopX protein [Listeria fleischmannii subsp. coloradonensis]